MRRFQSGNSFALYNHYKNILNIVNIFEYADLLQEYELYKLVHGRNDCFDFFFRNLIKKAYKRKDMLRKNRF